MLIPHHLVQMIDAAALSVAVSVRLSATPPRFQLIGPRQAEKAGGGLTAHFLTGRSALFNWDSV